MTYASCSDVSLAPGFRVVGAPLESVITAAQVGLTALSLTPGNARGLPPPEPSVRPALTRHVSSLRSFWRAAKSCDSAVGLALTQRTRSLKLHNRGFSRLLRPSLPPEAKRALQQDGF